MRHHRLLLSAFLILAVVLAAGCGMRQLTKGETDRLDAIAAKIAEAERMDAKDCAPKELARAKAELDHARHEAGEGWEKGQALIARADKAADALLDKTRPCWEARQPKPAPPPAASPPTVLFSADPDTVEAGKCSTLKWSTTDATRVSIDPGIGEGGTSGEKQVCPTETTLYTITANGPGGTATATAKVTVIVPPPPPAVEGAPKFENIHFDFDKSAIRPDDKPILQGGAAYLKKNKGAAMLIEGHCDERGTSEYNMALGDRRANSAKKYLVGLGIDAKRLSTISYGKERPFDPGHNEDAWAKNRRVVFVLK